MNTHLDAGWFGCTIGEIPGCHDLIHILSQLTSVKKKIKRLQHSWKGGVLLMIRNHCCASSMVEFILLLIVCVIYMSKRYHPSILKDTMLTNCYTQDVYYIKHNFPSSPWRSIGPSWWFPKHITKTIPMSLWRFSVPIYSIDGPYNKMICQTNRLLTRT